MENAPRLERFFGPEFSVGQKVRWRKGESSMQGLEMNALFTVKSVQREHRADMGEHDDMGSYHYQTVELDEVPGVMIAVDRLELI